MEHLLGILAGNCFSKSMCCNTRWGAHTTFILGVPFRHVRINWINDNEEKLFSIHGVWEFMRRYELSQAVHLLSIKEGKGHASNTVMVCISYQAAAIFKGRNREWVQGRKEDAAVGFCIYGLFIWSLCQHLNFLLKRSRFPQFLCLCRTYKLL